MNRPHTFYEWLGIQIENDPENTACYTMEEMNVFYEEYLDDYWYEANFL